MGAPNLGLLGNVGYAKDAGRFSFLLCQLLRCHAVFFVWANYDTRSRDLTNANEKTGKHRLWNGRISIPELYPAWSV